MKYKIMFLKVDIFIQSAILLLLLLSIAMPYIILLMMILLGFWQIISGFIGALILKEMNHGIYLIGAFTYLGFLYQLEYAIDLELGSVLGFLTWFIIPIAIAIWYLRLTKRTLEKYQLESAMIF